MTKPTKTETNWQEESRRFDGVAALYDIYRPNYPEELLEILILMTGLQPDSKILEIGSGTGKATLMLAKRNFSVHCIEPGHNLVAVAKRNLKDFPQVTFEAISFEEWNLHPKRYDLVISAQAFHWIPREIGFSKAAQALKNHGHLALFWNMYPDPESPIFLELKNVYQACAPELSDGPNSFEAVIEQRESDFQESGLFYNVKTYRFPWSVKYEVQEYLGLLNTYSDHLRLPEEKRKNLYEEVANVIQRHGGKIEKPYLAVLHIAQKAA
jgi:SAM-dependent methyltransferase